MSLSSKEQKALQAVLDRATTDAAFRRRLLADPRRAILDGFGVTIPLGFNVRFVEKEPGIDALIVLPDLRRPEGELSDQDLDAVAGGTDPTPDDNWFR